MKRAYPRRSRASGARPPSDPSGADDLPRRLDYVVGRLGSNQTARLLRVAQSQPSRWKAGIEGVGGESRRRILDLDYVLARLLELYPRELAEVWLESHNAHLGARPIDVLQLRGAAPVIEAIDAEAEGAFA